MVSLDCKRKVYFPGQIIVEEGKPGDGLWIFSLGEAAVTAMGIKISSCQPGHNDSFGAASMLGLLKTVPATLTAINICFVLLITRETYVMALQKYPAPQVAAALVESEKDSA